MAGLSSGSSLKDRETLSREDEADREEDPEYEDDLADVDAADDDEEDPEYVEHEDDPAVLGAPEVVVHGLDHQKVLELGP